MGRCVYGAQSTTFSRKLRLGKTLDGNLKFCTSGNWTTMMWLMDGKPDSTDEDTPPNFSIGQNQTLVASDEIQVNVMQKSVVCTGSGQML